MTQSQSTNGANPLNGEVPAPSAGNARSLVRVCIWIGIAGLSAALAFTVVRALLNRRAADPTSQRIQQLIDEANTLLKTLDDQRIS